VLVRSLVIPGALRLLYLVVQGLVYPCGRVWLLHGRDTETDQQAGQPETRASNSERPLMARMSAIKVDGGRTNSGQYQWGYLSPAGPAGTLGALKL